MAGIGKKKATGIYETRNRLEERVVMIHSEGKWNYTQIAKMTGTSVRTVKRILEEHRKQSEYQRKGWAFVLAFTIAVWIPVIGIAIGVAK